MSKRGVRFLDLTGQTYNGIEVLKFVKMSNHGKAMWLCRCHCGKLFEVIGGNLRSGTTNSCGCLTLARLTTHGMTGSKVHEAWQSMIQRCYNPNHKSYKNYGGRGITTDERWRYFEAFYEDMGDPEPGQTLERVDVNLGYFKANCVWANWTQQGRNKRTNKLISFNGRTLCVSAWAEELGIPKTTLGNRLRRGWTIERALTTSVIPRSLQANKAEKQPNIDKCQGSTA